MVSAPKQYNAMREDQTKSHLKSLSFLIRVQTCRFTVDGFFWTIFPVSLLGACPLYAFDPLSGLIPMQILNDNVTQML